MALRRGFPPCMFPDPMAHAQQEGLGTATSCVDEREHITLLPYDGLNAPIAFSTTIGLYCPRLGGSPEDALAAVLDLRKRQG